MSQQLPRIDLPDLLYWEIMEAAEENQRTLAEEVIYRLRQTQALRAVTQRVKGE
jgi:hypothetical protein